MSEKAVKERYMSLKNYLTDFDVILSLLRKITIFSRMR